MERIETVMQDKPTCPYYGYQERDAWDINFGPFPEGDTLITCGGCDEEYECYRIVQVSYSSHKAGP